MPYIWHFIFLALASLFICPITCSGPQLLTAISCPVSLAVFPQGSFCLLLPCLATSDALLSALLNWLKFGAPLVVQMHHSLAHHTDPKLSSLQDAFPQAFAHTPASAAANAEACFLSPLLQILPAKTSSSLLCSMGNPLHTNPRWYRHSWSGLISDICTTWLEGFYVLSLFQGEMIPS